MESRIARICQNKTAVSIGTHDGKFHTDELVAIALIAHCFGHQCKFQVIRSRDPKILEQCDIVLDVGYKNHGKYFDHHGRDFNELHPGTKFKLAATGIVWYDLKNIILDQLGLRTANRSVREMTEELIFKRLVLPTDADDNGQFAARPSGPQPITLPEIVNAFNTPFGSGVLRDNFHECLDLVRTVMRRKLMEISKQALENNRIHTALLEAPIADKQAGIFVLQQQGPWITVVLNNWEDTTDFKVCIFPGDIPGQWRIQSFPGSKYERRTMRCPAPDWMKGYQKNSVKRLTEEFDVIFVHSDGFIGCVEGTLEEAKAFAKLWISQSGN